MIPVSPTFYIKVTLMGVKSYNKLELFEVQSAGIYNKHATFPPVRYSPTSCLAILPSENRRQKQNEQQQPIHLEERLMSICFDIQSVIILQIRHD